VVELGSLRDYQERGPTQLPSLYEFHTRIYTLFQPDTLNILGRRTEKSKGKMVRSFKFSIDRGGTFTDIFCDTGTRHCVSKLLSEDPSNYKDAPTEGIRRILEQVTTFCFAMQLIFD
jgi:hypothetical protein